MSTTSLSTTQQNNLLIRLQRLYSSKLAIAVLLGVFLVIYFTNALHAIDYPEYDETYYVRRAIGVLEGHAADANLGNLRNSPLMVLYDAAWYALIQSADVYKWIFVSSLCLLAYAAYLLMLRTFHPLLSAAFALVALLSTTPQIPQNMRFAVGTALLWLSLYLLGGKVASRAVGVLMLIFASYVRPEYLSCLLIVVPLLLIYEWREMRRKRRLRTYTVLIYLPVIVTLAFTGFRLWQLSGYQEPRIVRTIPFSYGGYMMHVQPDRIDPTLTMSDQPVFYQDFGLPEKTDLSSELVAMTQHLDKTIPYLANNTLQFAEAFSAAAFDAPLWNLAKGYRFFPDSATFVKFAVFVIVLAVLTAFAIRAARRANPKPSTPLNLPLLLGYLSLITLIPWMILANPDQRAFMVFPLAFLPLGYAITIIARNVRLSAWIPAAVIALLLVIFPRPFVGYEASFGMNTLAFIREHVPPYAVVMGSPVESYANSLYADHFVIIPVEGTNYTDPVLVNAYQANPDIQYVLFTYVYSPEYYRRWFAEWKAAYPDLQWTLVAERRDMQLSLYRLERNPTF